MSVYVHEDELELARALLLADAVDAAFDERYNDLGPNDAGALDLPPVGLPVTTRFQACPNCSGRLDGRPRAAGGVHHVVSLSFARRRIGAHLAAVVGC